MMACVLGGMMAIGAGFVSPQSAAAQDVWAYTSGESQGYVETDDIHISVDSRSITTHQKIQVHHQTFWNLA